MILSLVLLGNIKDGKLCMCLSSLYLHFLFTCIPCLIPCFPYRKQKGEAFDALLIICGRRGKYAVSTEITEMLEGLDTPVISVEMSTHEAMHLLHNFTPKLNHDDRSRVEKAISHYEPQIDFDELIRRTNACDSSFNDPGSIKYEELVRM